MPMVFGFHTFCTLLCTLNLKIEFMILINELSKMFNNSATETKDIPSRKLKKS